MDVFSLIGVIAIPVQILLFAISLYWLLIALFGFGEPRKILEHQPEKQFLVIIPAHNEEKVIERIIKNLNNMDYPQQLFDVVVVADNCSDRTAEISADNGALVIEHRSKEGEPRGKPYAISYAFKVLNEVICYYDAFCIFDADNLVSVNYFRVMNNHLAVGHKLIQCYLDSKNPTDNWITLSYAASYYYMNRSWQLAKSKLGLGNAIGGTGFCVHVDVLTRVGWQATSLTEDLEFQLQCLLNNIPARWAHDTRVYDEKPVGFNASNKQRLRWARGHWDLCSRYSFKLIKKAVKDRDILAFDGFIYLINPGKIVVHSFIFLLCAAGFLYPQLAVLYLFPLWFWVTLIIFHLNYLMYCIAIDAQLPPGKLFSGLAYLPIFNWVYVPLFVWGLITKKNDIWIRTDHTRDIDLDDITSAEEALSRAMDYD